MQNIAAGPEKETDRKVSAKSITAIHNESKDVFTGIGCIEGMFSLQVKEVGKLYQVPARCMVYVLKQPFKQKLECLKKKSLYHYVSMEHQSDPTALYWSASQIKNCNYSSKVKSGTNNTNT